MLFVSYEVPADMERAARQWLADGGHVFNPHRLGSYADDAGVAQVRYGALTESSNECWARFCGLFAQDCVAIADPLDFAAGRVVGPRADKWPYNADILSAAYDEWLAQF